MFRASYQSENCHRMKAIVSKLMVFESYKFFSLLQFWLKWIIGKNLNGFFSFLGILVNMQIGREPKTNHKKVSLEEQIKRLYFKSLLRTTSLYSFQFCWDSVQRTLMYLQPAFYCNQAHKRKHKYEIDCFPITWVLELVGRYNIASTASNSREKFSKDLKLFLWVTWL